MLLDDIYILVEVGLCSIVGLLETDGESHVQNAFEMVCVLLPLGACGHQHRRNKPSRHRQWPHWNRFAHGSVWVLLFEMQVLGVPVPRLPHKSLLDCKALKMGS